MERLNILYNSNKFQIVPLIQKSVIYVDNSLYLTNFKCMGSYKEFDRWYYSPYIYYIMSYTIYLFKRLRRLWHMTLISKIQNIQNLLLKKMERRFQSAPFPKFFVKTLVIMFLLILMTTDSTYSIIDIVILLVGAPLLIYFILFGYKYLLWIFFFPKISLY